MSPPPPPRRAIFRSPYCMCAQGAVNTEAQSENGSSGAYKTIGAFLSPPRDAKMPVGGSKAVTPQRCASTTTVRWSLDLSINSPMSSPTRGKPATPPPGAEPHLDWRNGVQRWCQPHLDWRNGVQRWCQGDRTGKPWHRSAQTAVHAPTCPPSPPTLPWNGCLGGGPTQRMGDWGWHRGAPTHRMGEGRGGAPAPAGRCAPPVDMPRAMRVHWGLRAGP